MRVEKYRVCGVRAVCWPWPSNHHQTAWLCVACPEKYEAAGRRAA